MSRGMSVLLFAVALAIAYWCYSNFERVTEPEFVGFSGEAARNPMLAFERLVHRMGFAAAPATERAALDNLPLRATLVLGRNRNLSPQRVKAIAAWVSGGGHLIVEAERPNERDPVLDALGVSRRAAPRRASSDEISVRLPGEGGVLRADLPLIGFEYLGGESYSTPAGPAQALLHARHGNGQFTVLSSFDFMRNDDIGEHDHATLAWEVVRLMPDTVRVLIARRSAQLSLLDWLIEHAQGVAIALTALLTFWLWRIGRRFGPVEPPRQPRRRRLLDHLRASGHFQWAAGSAPGLLAAAREACLAKVARTRPAVANLPPTARNARLSELTRLPPEEIGHALDGDAATQRAFTAAVSTLQQIEDKLTHSVSA